MPDSKWYTLTRLFELRTARSSQPSIEITTIGYRLPVIKHEPFLEGVGHIMLLDLICAGITAPGSAYM